MPRIWHENKTVEWRTNPEDEAASRVDLQELLDANPGYTPVLIVEDAKGKEKTYSSLSVAPIAEEEPAEVVEEAGDPDNDEDDEDDEDEDDEDDEDEDEDAGTE